MEKLEITQLIGNFILYKGKIYQVLDVSLGFTRRYELKTDLGYIYCSLFDVEKFMSSILIDKDKSNLEVEIWRKLDGRFTDIMIDIETLDTKPTAAILSIAAVAFNLTTGKTSDNIFYDQLDYVRQIEENRTTSIQTTLWWGAQSNEVQDENFNGEQYLHQSVLELNGYFAKECFTDRRVWAKSPAFDLVILKNAYGEAIFPWHYTNERDVRTYCDFDNLGLGHLNHIPATHKPLEDCFAQIRDVCAVYSLLHSKTDEESR